MSLPPQPLLQEQVSVNQNTSTTTMKIIPLSPPSNHNQPPHSTSSIPKLPYELFITKEGKESQQPVDKAEFTLGATLAIEEPPMQGEQTIHGSTSDPTSDANRCLNTALLVNDFSFPILSSKYYTGKEINPLPKVNP